VLKTSSSQTGFSLLEVLIAILITAFGLLGLAALMGKMQVFETEGYDRSQAMALLWNMRDRIQAGMRTDSQANALADANAYTDSGAMLTVGTGVSGYTPPCTGSGATLDLCEWHNALLGAAETRSSTNVGAMTGARGCTELVTAPDLTKGVCTPATFRVSVAWQGLVDSAAPDTTSGANQCGKDAYGTESKRRIISQQITIGIPGCTN